MLTIRAARRFAAPTVLFVTLVCAGSLWVSAAFDVVARIAEAGASENPKEVGLSEAGAKIKDLGWLEGTWRMTQGSGEMEERWSGPMGDCLVGTFRWLRSSRVWMYEIMTISKDKDRIIFRLKHFDRKLTGWEEKDEALTYPMAKSEPNRVVFENPKRDEPRRFVYSRPVPETLVVRLEGYKDGKSTVQEFRFSRVKP